MPLRTYRTYQALILAGLGLFLLDKIWSGKLTLYINQRYVILILLAGLGLLALAQGVMYARPKPPGMATAANDGGKGGGGDPPEKEAGAQHQQAGSALNLALVLVPLILGLVIPPRALNASAIAVRGVNVSSPLSVSGNTLASANNLAPGDRNVLDWIRAFNNAKDGSKLDGQPVDITGFIYHDPRLSKTQFMVDRFAITCCVADALAVGMVVEWPEAAEMTDNGWVRVRGTIKAAMLEGQSIPLIQAETVEEMPVPEQPYLFP
jgi:putative membrane protein